MDEERTNIKMDDCVARFFTRFGGNDDELMLNVLRCHLTY